MYVANNRITIVTSLSGPFEEAVIAYLFLVNILPIFLIPLMWWETRKICSLVNDWDDFEVKMLLKMESNPLGSCSNFLFDIL